MAFQSAATTLVSGDTNKHSDVFVRDRQMGSTERVSVSTAGAEGAGDSLFPSISADGRFVAFLSGATNLVAGDTSKANDAFVRDRLTGSTVRVSVSAAGAQGNGNSINPKLSDDGHFVTFFSDADNLVPGDTNKTTDVFIAELN